MVSHITHMFKVVRLAWNWTYDGRRWTANHFPMMFTLRCSSRSGGSAACVRSVWLLKQSSCSSKRCESFLLRVGSHGLTTTLFPLEQVRGAAKMGEGATAYSRMFIWLRLGEPEKFFFLFYQWLISFGYLVISGMPLSAFPLSCGGRWPRRNQLSYSRVYCENQWWSLLVSRGCVNFRIASLCTSTTTVTFSLVSLLDK